MPAIRAIDKLEDILASSENFLKRMHELGQEHSEDIVFIRYKHFKPILEGVK